jgi:Mycothiol maleylpyruvate isomerase N-terminal domain
MEPICVRPRVLLVRVDRELIFAAVANERRQIATLMDSLDDPQLATPSLCAGWDVAQVTADHPEIDYSYREHLRYR